MCGRSRRFLCSMILVGATAASAMRTLAISTDAIGSRAIRATCSCASWTCLAPTSVNGSTDRDREYSLRESETRTLATVGAFRVVSSSDLNDHGREADPHSGDLRHLREERLIRTIPMEGSRDVAVVLTDRGKHLLESHRRERDHDPRDHDPRDEDRRQEFYSGLVKPRELEHDAHVFEAYLHEVERLLERDARVEHVLLDYELKREYQEWLHERDSGV